MHRRAYIRFAAVLLLFVLCAVLAQPATKAYRIGWLGNGSSRYFGDRNRNAQNFLPARCQFWFRLGDAYFVSDSDSERRAKILSRTVKQ